MDQTAAEDSESIAMACPQGLDIRGAFLLAKWAQASPAEITLSHEGYQADAKSLMSILWLGVRSRGVVTVTVRGAGAAAALSGLEALLEVPGPAVFARLPGPRREMAGCPVGSRAEA